MGCASRVALAGRAVFFAPVFLPRFSPSPPFVLNYADSSESESARRSSLGGSNPDDLDLGATIKGFSGGQQVFGRYQLIKILGRGGMGVVWLAEDEKLGRKVALKFLPEVVSLDDRAVDDLKRETRRSLDLTHPHIVRIHDFVDDAQSAAIVMEWIDGATLSSLALEQPGRVLGVEALTPWVQQLCEALAYAHAVAQVVHRDIKPANLMVDAAGRLKVADFGIAASVSDSVSRVSKQAGSSGTPLYMSPQQMMGEDPKPADDVYAVGATLYELLAGKPPFFSGNVMMQVMNKPAPDLRERRAKLVAEEGIALEALPDVWVETIAACLAKEAVDRPQSAGDVWKRLNGEEGLTTKHTKDTKAEGQGGLSRREHGGGTAFTESETKVGTDRRAVRESRSKAPMLLGIIGVVAMAAAGWWFGVEQPARRALEVERENRAAELDRLEQQRVDSQARSERKASLPQLGSRFEIEGLGLTMMPISAGTFTMGSPSGESGRGKDEVAHRVTLTKPFWLGATEVTQGQWEALMGNNPSSFKNVGKNAPVESVSWQEAMTYGLKLTERERAAGRLPAGYEYTLPTEAQWEYACRAGTTGPYAGDLAAMGWYDSNSGKTTHAVGQKQANAWGLYDMHGNVLEWCLDMYGDYPSSSVTDPAGALGTSRVNRGGSLGSTAQYARSAYRGSSPSRLPFNSIGFRVALSAVEGEKSAGLAKPAMAQARTVPGLDLRMQPIAAGSFTMGSPIGESGRSDNEVAHQVTLTKPYWLGATEVTQGQWEALMGSTVRQQRDKENSKWPLRGEGSEFPMYYVSWEEAMAYGRKLTERERAAGRLPEGYEYTLPTEAQWEYACRAGTTGPYAGDLAAMGWYDGNSGKTTHAVGQKRPNAWGLYDMHGNVSEWCHDWYNRYPASSVTDPANASSGSARVHRGGSWSDTAARARSAYHFGYPPGYRVTHLGFRVALSAVR